METKQVLNNEVLDQVYGGTEIEYIHANCGGHMKCEDHGIYGPDLWLKCPKCGKSWHPHSYNKLEKCEDVYTVVTGTY